MLLCIIGKMVLKQDIGISMGIDPASFWASLSLYFFESKYIKRKSINGSLKHINIMGFLGFIDDLFAINVDIELLTSFKKIYPKELELRVEHQGNHVSFLDLDIKIDDSIFVYKLFDKREKFPFFIFRVSSLSSNISSTIFYGSKNFFE